MRSGRYITKLHAKNLGPTVGRSKRDAMKIPMKDGRGALSAARRVALCSAADVTLYVDLYTTGAGFLNRPGHTSLET